MAFSGPKLLFETTEISTHPNSTQQESNYIYLRYTQRSSGLSRIYLSKHVYYLGLKIGSQVKHPVIDFDIFTLGYFTI
jgi:hypothetical protein